MPTATGPNGEKLQLENGQWVPMNTPQERLQAEQAIFSGTATDRSARAQGIKTGLATIAANALSIPHAIGELLPSQPEFLRSMPNPDAKDVLAALGTIPQALDSFNKDVALYREGGPTPNPYTALGKGFDEALATEQAAESEHPFATGVGRTAGDVATMLTLRPSQRVGGLLGLSEPVVGEAPGLARAGKLLARGVARMGQSGFDAASLAAMGDGDPAEAAAYGAAVQGLGSAALGAKGAIMANPLKSLGALWLGHEMFKSLAPGPQDAFTSKDTAVNEIVSALLLGTAASAAGAGRPTGAITGLLSNAGRASVASGITQMQERSKRKPSGRESKTAQLRGLLGYEDEDED